MPEWAGIAAVFGFGAALGLVFAGLGRLAVSLWPAMARPGPLFVCALAVHVLIVAIAMYFVLHGGRWERLLACLLGFAFFRGLHMVWDRARAERPAEEG